MGVTWLLAAVVAAAAALPARAADRENRPLIVALGDSLTSGRGIGAAAAFPAVLQERLDAAGYTYRMVNAGVSGDTTTRALRRYQAALDGRVQILIVALGANDGLRGIPVAQLKANLSAIIEEAQARGIAVLLVGMDALPLRGWVYSLAFHHAYEELATRFHIPLVPFVLINVLPNPALMQDDRAHPNAAGARAIANLIWPHLEPLLKKTG